jgi:hypothetical protein
VYAVSSPGKTLRNSDPLPLVPDPHPTRGRKFYIAMACYGAIAALAWFTLDGKFLWVVWIFLVWFAIRTYISTLHRP